MPANTYEIPSNGKLTVNLKPEEYGLTILYVLGEEIRLFVNDSSQIDLYLNAQAITKSLKFFGKNARGLELLNEAHYVMPEILAEKEFNISDPNTLLQKCNNQKRSLINRFTSLFRGKEIDSSFYEFIKVYNDYYFASIIAWSSHNQILKNQKKYSGFIRLWKKTFLQYPIGKESAMQTECLLRYIDNFVMTNDLINSKSDTIKIRIDRNDRIKHTITTIRQHLPPERLERVIGAKLYCYYFQKNYETALLPLYTDYIKSYPASNYIPQIQPFYVETINFYKKNDEDNKNIKFLSQNDFQTLNTLFRPFTGKFLFVDFWATWCGPCKDQFAFEQSVVNFLNNRKIQKLFVSFDDETLDATWKKMIYYYNLEGLHIRVNTELKNEILNQLGTNSTLTLPRYLLVNPDGKISIFKTYLQSDGEKLYRQLDQALKAWNSN